MSFYILFLHRSDQKDTYDDNSIKIQIQMKKFFSEEKQVNLSNIDNEMSANYMFDILSIISAEQIEQTIYRLLNDKVFESDNISNEVLKIMISLIKKNLTQTISKSFIKKMTSRSF